MEAPTRTATPTQTEEEDSVDSSIVIAHHWYKNGAGTDVVDSSRGFLSNLFTMALPTKKRDDFQRTNSDTFQRNARTTATQTEEQDPIAARGQQLSYLVIQELALENPMNLGEKDEVLDTLSYCVAEIIEKHSILFNGMVRRIEVTQYHMFEYVANELFETNANANNGLIELQITWGRIVSLFAFAVRLAKENREYPERVDYITRFLATYITKHIIPFVQENGGWNGLVDHFPPPEDGDPQIRRAMVMSGLCVGLIAAACVSSMLR